MLFVVLVSEIEILIQQTAYSLRKFSLTGREFHLPNKVQRTKNHLILLLFYYKPKNIYNRIEI